MLDSLRPDGLPPKVAPGTPQPDDPIMRPKGKLFALLALFVAIGLITASGAFTTVTAERTATVDTSSDANALLGLEPNASSPNGNYVDGGNQLDITFENNSHTLNQNATTTFHHMFNVTNNGEQTVTVTISDDAETTNLNEDDFLIYQGSNTGSSLESGGVELSPGETLSVGIQVDTSALTGTTSFDVNMTVDASA